MCPPPNTFDFEINESPVNVGKGRLVVNGLDLTRAVRSFELRSTVGEVTELHLDLVNLSVEHGVVGNGVVVIRVAKDGWSELKPATPKILGAIAHLHDLLDADDRLRVDPSDSNEPVPADDEQAETA